MRGSIHISGDTSAIRVEWIQPKHCFICPIPGKTQRWSTPDCTYPMYQELIPFYRFDLLNKKTSKHHLQWIWNLFVLPHSECTVACKQLRKVSTEKESVQSILVLILRKFQRVRLKMEYWFYKSVPNLSSDLYWPGGINQKISFLVSLHDPTRVNSAGWSFTSSDQGFKILYVILNLRSTCNE